MSKKGWRFVNAKINKQISKNKNKIISFQLISTLVSGQHWQFTLQCFIGSMVLVCQGRLHKQLQGRIAVLTCPHTLAHSFYPTSMVAVVSSVASFPRWNLLFLPQFCHVFIVERGKTETTDNPCRCEKAHGCECAVKGLWEHNRWIAEQRRCMNSSRLLAFVKTFHKIYYVYECVMHQKKWTLALFFLFIEAVTPCPSDLHVEFKKWWDALTPRPCLVSIWMINWLFEITIRRTMDKGGNWRQQLTPVNQNLNSFLLHN